MVSALHRSAGKAPEPAKVDTALAAVATLAVKAGAKDRYAATGSGPRGRTPPAHVEGPVRVVNPDIYNLDHNGDGVGCES
jgi:hypothetical protein